MILLIQCPGKKISNADALSRLPIQIPDSNVPLPLEALFVEDLADPPVSAREISKFTLHDRVLSRVLSFVEKGWPEGNLTSEFCTFSRHVKSYQYIRGVFYGEICASLPGDENSIVQNSCRFRWAIPRSKVHAPGGLSLQVARGERSPRLLLVFLSTSFEILSELMAFVVSDNGPPFRSLEYQSLLQANGVRLVLVAPHRAAGNGQTERLVQFANDSLKQIFKDS